MKVGDFFNVKTGKKGCDGKIVSIENGKVWFVWQYSYIAGRQIDGCSVKVFEKKYRIV
jgi:hypothetical protein